MSNMGKSNDPLTSQNHRSVSSMESSSLDHDDATPHPSTPTKAYSILSGKVADGDLRTLDESSIAAVSISTSPRTPLVLQAQETKETKEFIPGKTSGEAKSKDADISQMNAAAIPRKETEQDFDNQVDDVGHLENSQSNKPKVDSEDETPQETSDPPPPPPPPPLFKSTRLNGYLRICFLACLAFISAYESDFEHQISDYIMSDSHDAGGTVANSTYGAFQDNTTIAGGLLVFKGGRPPIIVKANEQGRNFAMVASGLSASLTICIVALFFIDALLPLGKRFRNSLRMIFAPKSITEITILVFLSVWWIISVWIITSIRGIAGDGKGQYNLYFSTWMCLVEVLSMNERWLVAADYSSIKQSMSGWPNRAPGWIIIFITTLSNLICILDLRANGKNGSKNEPLIHERYAEIHPSQWAWLIFVCIASFSIAFFFSIVELFRREQEAVNVTTSRRSFMRIGSSGRSINQNQEVTFASLRSQTDDSERQEMFTEGHTETKKTNGELCFEGFCLLFLVLLWVPTVVISTMTKFGAASAVGNAYFFTWGSCVSVIHTFIGWLKVWRKSIHAVIIKQNRDYIESQFRVLHDMNTISDDGAMVQDVVVGGTAEDESEHLNQLHLTANDDHNGRTWFNLMLSRKTKNQDGHEESRDDKEDGNRSWSTLTWIKTKLRIWTSSEEEGMT